MNDALEQPPSGEPKIDYSQLEIEDQGDNHTIYANPVTGERYIEDDSGITPIVPRDPHGTYNDLKATSSVSPTQEFPAPQVKSPTVSLGESKPERVSYQEAVAQSYSAKKAAVDGYIATGKLSESYRLPEEIDPDSLLGQRIAALETIYGHMPAAWQPRVVFYPQGLTAEQWSQLLTGHVLFDRRSPEHADGKQSQGLFFGIREHKLTSNTGFNGEATEPWDAAVISSAERPPINGVSPDGSEIIDQEYIDSTDPIVKIAESLPNLGVPLQGTRYYQDAISREQIVRLASPSIDTYLGLQLTLLENTEKYIDELGVVIGKGRELEELGNDRVRQIPFTMRWDSENATVNIIPTSSNSMTPRNTLEQNLLTAKRDYLQNKGIRPTVSGRDVVPT